MITIFSKDMCPYCDMAKWLLTALWLEYKEIDVTNDFEKISEIAWISWMMTLPQIFNKEIIRENLLWGYDDLKALNDEGKLMDLLNK